MEGAAVRRALRKLCGGGMSGSRESGVKESGRESDGSTGGETEWGGSTNRRCIDRDGQAVPISAVCFLFGGLCLLRSGLSSNFTPLDPPRHLGPHVNISFCVLAVVVSDATDIRVTTMAELLCVRLSLTHSANVCCLVNASRGWLPQ